MKAPALMRFSVAMATYNGEAYILDQLESLARQTLAPRELVVCDDGSADGTLSIIASFAETAPFPVILHRSSQHLGFGDAFLKAASMCNGEWIAFCDQDDVWLPEKLRSIDQAIRECEDDDLMMVAHSADVVHATLTSANRKVPDFADDMTLGPLGHRGFWVIPGFACAFRRELISSFDWRVRPVSYDASYPMQPHDKWICMLANALGSIRYIKESLVLYRRHAQTVTGGYEKQSLFECAAACKGADHYAFLTRAARQTSTVLSGLARTDKDPVWAKRLAECARQFDKLALIYSGRAEIYQEEAIIRKLAKLCILVQRRGYHGNNFSSLGAKSFAKDLFHCFTGGLSAKT